MLKFIFTATSLYLVVCNLSAQETKQQNMLIGSVGFGATLNKIGISYSGGITINDFYFAYSRTGTATLYEYSTEYLRHDLLIGKLYNSRWIFASAQSGISFVKKSGEDDNEDPYVKHFVSVPFEGQIMIKPFQFIGIGAKMITFANDPPSLFLLGTVIVLIPIE